ncbi:hypothetical protein GLP21_18465 [Photobacterium carnosum]|uniref:Peptidase S26 domain-containing protein n=1 Tax=Photobacterium carnosum TaxID=2023717 RepID=A0A2N4UWN2_9GAMM|nr:MULTISPECIES: S26 family signal peptidase [Photobacterium]MCD9476333.1 hypothetical protein [Photobacterium phosphoreum]MCD9488882.1 hypothetical protein [Photobacterium iliopiscarium]MCD9508109.1 hypothetical protein [Photobacterium phosphoreum]MCD9539334.1 hypothetical protein [Photobacterium carnosum]MCD9542316.1 hypothetical protein [Photobacterium carnosum]
MTITTTSFEGVKTSFFKERIRKPIILGGILVLSISAFCNRYTIIPPTGSVPCISGLVFLLDRHDMNIHEGDLVTFLAKNTQLFANDTVFTKLVVGDAGDEVKVNRNSVSNAGKVWNTDITVAAQVLKMPLDKLSRTERIKENHLFAIGTLPGSYDSRFWGEVNIEEQVVGKTYVLI